MALFKDFTFDGENSKDYGVYISGDAVYDAPERAMDMVQIPGRNGALALDNGYYNNIDVTYPAGCFADDQADFAAKLSRIRNMLASRHRYCRLEDAYHPDHFRMALYKSGLDVAPVARNKAGRFNIIFDAKPQRFLKSGEIVQELDADAPPTTSYGPADIVTFEGEPGDAIVHAQLSLEPIQDLHGYGNPYPAGGGKNKINPNTVTANSWINIDTGAIESGHSDYVVSDYIPVIEGQQYVKSGYGNTNRAYFYASDKTPVSRWNSDVITIPSGVSYARVTITASLLSTSAMVEAGSTATPYAPYSNICPITGWTGANVTRTGKNIFDEASARWKYDYLLDSTGAESSNSAYKYTENYTLVGPSTTYAIQMYKSTTTSSALTVCQYDANKNFVKRTVAITAASGTGVRSGTFTTVENVRYIRFSAPRNSDSAKGSRDFMIEVGSTASTYEAFAGGVYSFTWETEVGAIFRGTLNVLTGELAIETGYTESTADGTMLDHYPDGTTASRAWTFNAPYAYCSCGTATFVPVASLDRLEAMCNQFVEVQRATATTSEDNSFAIRVTSTIRRFTFRQTSIPDWDVGSTNAEKAEKVRAYWAAQYALGNKLQVVYKLATPYVIQLTAAEVTTLLGVNNIFSDAGTTTITVQSPYELENPTLYPSKPLIRVYGSGTIQVNNITITVAEHSGYIDIDCDMMDCHRGADNMNQYVSFSGNDFPELQPGINRILLNGPDKVEVTPRWWEL